MGERKWNKSDKEREGGKRRKSTTWEFGCCRQSYWRATLLHVAGIWSQLWQQHSKARSMESEEEWLALTDYTRKARRMELKDDTDVSLWPSQPSVMGSWPSHRLVPSCGESGGRVVMTSHYELGAVLWTWPTTNSTLPCTGVDKGHTNKICLHWSRKL